MFPTYLCGASTNSLSVAATAFNGWGTTVGTCSIHSWNEGVDSDEAFQRKGLRLDAKLRVEEEEDEI